jgi:DNA processing protein
VLGSGLSRIQPISNLPLAERLVAAGGLLVSEYPLGMSARPQHFPERNRLISGLADVVVVVEAGERSGSLITARLALEQGREVLAVPGAISQPNSRGVHRLLKQGAGLVDCAQDVFDVLGNLRLPHRGDEAESAWADSERGLAGPEAETGLDEDARRLLAEMRDLSTSIDELCFRCGESPARVAALLARLELSGFVARSGGGYIRRPFSNSGRNRR